jgi:hypothetical protein
MASLAPAAGSCTSCARSPSTSAGPQCAPRMSDGRLFTDYRPRCDANSTYQAPMSGSYEYRQHMIANGAALIERDRATAAQMASCAPCLSGFGTMAPEADRVVCDKVSCARVAVPDATSQLAIGTGRGA